MKIYISALLLFCFHTCFAQVREIGVKTGLTNSLINITGPDAQNNTAKFKTDYGQSFYVQAFTQFFQYKNFSLQAGVGMIEKNSDYQYKEKIAGIPDSVRINSLLETRSFFVEVDAKLKLLIPELPKVVPYLMFGPQMSFVNKKTNTIPFALKSPVVQGVFGVGADIDLKKLHFFVEYNRFLSFNNNYSLNSSYEYQEKASAFLLGLKFLLNPSKTKSAN